MSTNGSGLLAIAKQDHATRPMTVPLTIAVPTVSASRRRTTWRWRAISRSSSSSESGEMRKNCRTSPGPSATKNANVTSANASSPMLDVPRNRNWNRDGPKAVASWSSSPILAGMPAPASPSAGYI